LFVVPYVEHDGAHETSASDASDHRMSEWRIRVTQDGDKNEQD